MSNYNIFCPTSKSKSSLPCEAINCMPSGNFFPSTSEKPKGMEIAGTPTMFAVTVKISTKYIERGSLFSPIFQAGIGEVGVNIKSI